jgi:tryptophan 2,3-dioxygenase
MLDETKSAQIMMESETMCPHSSTPMPGLPAVFMDSDKLHRFAVDSETGERITPLIYPVLQGLPHLEAAREHFPVTEKSLDSLVKTVLQVMEIGLWNMVDLTRKATKDLQDWQIDQAAQKIKWVYGFNKVMGDVSLVVHSLGRGSASEEVVGVSDSQAFASFKEVFSDFGKTVLNGDIDIQEAIEKSDLHPALASILQNVVTIDNEVNNWFRRLHKLKIHSTPPSSADFIGAEHIKKAVFALRLEGDGDSRFTQFRGLHQIPETLCSEANERLHLAIDSIRGNKPTEAAMHLNVVNLLLPGMLSSIRSMFENLTVKDYHEIRAALELTSGSQSQAIRSMLFIRVYKELSLALLSQLTHLSSDELQLMPMPNVVENVRQCLERKTDAQKDWDVVIDRALQLRAGIQGWRDLHISFPKLYLGGQGTRSLIGAYAVKSADSMRTDGILQDPLAPVAAAVGLNVRAELLPEFSALSELLSVIDTVTAGLTQRDFQYVQERGRKFQHKED